MRKKNMVICFVVVFIGILFIIPKGTNNNLVSAVTEQFDIKDTFETQINNRIYTEYDNYTQEEYFRDYIGDEAHFTEDKEGFIAFGGATDNGISNSYFEIIALDDYDGYITPTVNLTEYPIIKFKVWVNVSTNYFYLNYRDYSSAYISNSEYFPLVGNEWNVFTIEIDYPHLDDIRKIRLEFHGSTPDEDYPILTRLDYVKFWKGNYTDYAFQSGDSWDFGEGDLENMVIHTNYDVISSSLSVGNEHLIIEYKSGGTATSYVMTKFINLLPSLDLSFYDNYIIRAKSNSSATTHIFYLYHPTYGLLSSIGDSVKFSDTWKFIKTDVLQEIALSDIYFVCRQQDILSASFKIEIDFINLMHNDLEDIETHKVQDTSSYRAYRGMKSFISNVPNNYTYYEGFTANLNSSIKIDVPSLEFFPEKIQFFIYMTTYFNLTLHIGDYEHILYENDLYLNEWMFVSKRIYRSNYLLNDTTDDIYFEITFNNADIQKTFYIDELMIKYTEPPQIFTHTFNTWTKTHLDGYDYSATNNFFYFEPSGEYEFSMNGDSDGIEYNSYSENLFTRRMFIDYTLDCDETSVNILIYQTIYISLDKEYRLVSALESRAESHTNPNSREIYMIHALYVGEEQIDYYSSGLIPDYTIDGYNNIEFNVRFQQEDYNTISISAIYNNKLTGNSTSGIFSFKINENLSMQNSLLMANITSQVTIRPVTSAPFVYIDSNPTATLKIAREIKHSEVVDSNPDINIPVAPEWRGGVYALADIWNYCVYYVQLFIYNVVEFFKQSMYLRDIVKGIGDFFSTFKDYWTTLVGYLSDFLSALGEIESIGDFISLVVETIVEHLVNVFNTLVLIVADVISSLGDIIDGDLLGFPVLDDIIDAWEAFVLRDWEDFGTAFKNIIPEINEDSIGFLLFIPDWFLSLWLDDVNFLSTLVLNGLKLVKEIFFWITILVIIYMVYFAQLVMRRDFDRIRIEVTTMVNVVNWIIDSIVFVFHWLFELLHAVLDVTIPFT